MLIVMKCGIDDAAREAVLEAVRARGLCPVEVAGPSRTAVCVTGNRGPVDPGWFAGLPGVLELVPITRGYKLASREVSPDDTVVRVGDVPLGGAHPTAIVAGPCSVESEERTLAIAHAARRAGARIFRGGAFKPRTSPYDFQGLGAEGLRILGRVREETGLPVVSEVVDAESAELGARTLDLLQIGARNMQNYSLLRTVCRLGVPVLLKRGPAATLTEWLMAAEYLLSGGLSQVVLCERGIRTFATHARNTLDLNVVPLVRRLSHLPILVDPSHGVGDRARVRPMGRAALAAGAHGLLVEAHIDPDTAYSDAAQTVPMDVLAGLVEDAEILARLARADAGPGTQGKSEAATESSGASPARATCSASRSSPP